MPLLSVMPGLDPSIHAAPVSGHGVIRGLSV
ncbi:hypothetical protein ACVIEM_002250 [Rhizobium leguminosarum]